eukprot:12498-Heterococcus_DN1.PRE.4
MGAITGIDTFARACGAPLSGYIFQSQGPRPLSLLCAALCAYVLLVTAALHRRSHRSSSSSKVKAA